MSIPPRVQREAVADLRPCEMPSVPDAETVALWSARQEALARLLRIPASELYDVADSSPFAQDARPSQMEETPSRNFHGKFDEHFVHDRFRLPEAQLRHVMEGLTSAAATHLEGSDSLARVKAAMAAQLAHDLEAQQSLLEHFESRKGLKKENGTCADTSAAVGPPAAGEHKPVTTEADLRPLTCVGGLDISFIPNSSLGVACLAVFRYPDLQPLRTVMHHCALTEPYISGFLAFREVEPVMGLFQTYKASLEAEQCWPQLLFIDGCGVHHPRRCGLASHLGALLDIPTIGCAKNMLVVDGVGREDVEACFSSVMATAGNHDASVPQKTRKSTNKARARTESAVGASEIWVPPLHPILGNASDALANTKGGNSTGRSMLGYALLTTGQSVKKSIFVSPGNHMGYAMAAALVLTVCHSRIPEPIRGADLSSRQYIREGRHLENAVVV